MKTKITQNPPDESHRDRQRRLGRLTRVLHDEYGFLTLEELRVLTKPFPEARFDFFDIARVGATTCRLGYVNDQDAPLLTCRLPDPIHAQIRRGDVFFAAIVFDQNEWRPIYVSPHLAARPAHDEWLEHFFPASGEVARTQVSG